MLYLFTFDFFACSQSVLAVQIDGDVVFFDGTVFENLDEGVLCRYFQVFLFLISPVSYVYMALTKSNLTSVTGQPGAAGG